MSPTSLAENRPKSQEVPPIRKMPSSLLYSLSDVTDDQKNRLASDPAPHRPASSKASFLRTVLTSCFARIAEVTFHRQTVRKAALPMGNLSKEGSCEKLTHAPENRCSRPVH